MSQTPETPENQPDSALENPSTSADEISEKVSEMPTETDVSSVEIAPMLVSETPPQSSQLERTPIVKSDDVVIVPRTTINYIVIAVVFFVIGMLMGSISFGSRIDEDAIAGAVEDVLIDAGLVQPPADMDVLVDDDPFVGPVDAPIVIVEFSAYACPYCGRHFNETLEPLLENYGQYIRYVFRDFPTINPNISLPAALAANCAREQNMFWEYHENLFLNQNTLIQTGTAYLNQVASDLGLDMPSFTSCVTEQRYLDEVNEDFNTGVAYGVSGTPSFYINGQAYSGARPYQYFENIIKRELARQGIEI